MTTVAVPLRVQGIDLDDDDTLDALGEHFSDLSWSIVDGITTATVFVPSAADPVCEALGVARRLMHKLPGVRIPRIYEELVSISDIAHRVGVSRETVRTWVEKLRGVDDFPEPVASVGGGARGATRVWAWTHVAKWLRDTRKLEVDEFGRLSAHQLAKLNAALARVEDPVDAAWTAVSDAVSATDVRHATRSATPRAAHRAPSPAVFTAASFTTAA